MIRVDAQQAGQIADWVESLAGLLGMYIPEGPRRGAGAVQKKAADLTRERGAIGASREYLQGWRVERLGVRASVAAAEVTNVAGHAAFVEEGVQPNSIPPETPEFLAWMRAKGIPEEASFPIRRHIHKMGTIKRAGARGSRKGLKIFEQAGDLTEDEVYELMEAAFDRALGAL